MSEQLQLIPNICPAEDDNGTKCQVEMTDEEVEQDGMCYRCADMIWDSVTTGAKFIIKDPKTREF